MSKKLFFPLKINGRKIAKILLFSFLFTNFLSSCASLKEQTRSESVATFPTNGKIAKSVYLIGDAGLSPENDKSQGLLALESYLKSNATQKDYLLFLGDNIYPKGMPAKDDQLRSAAENNIKAQIQVANGFKGTSIFIPGNHDYYGGGLDALEREKDFIQANATANVDWRPDVGCPISSKEISSDVVLLVIDSQWFIEKWDNHPTINADCDVIKTRKQFFLEIESELKKNQDATIIVAMHHPIYTNGPHGGKSSFEKHIFPTQSKFPLPVLGSLAAQLRSTSGISPQDVLGKRYQELTNRVSTLIRASNAKKVIVTSGHEHSLQYVEEDGIRQIVSGSGSKSSAATLGSNGHFSSGANGFARLDVMEDGTSWVRFFGWKDNNYSLLYSTQVVSDEIANPPYPAFTAKKLDQKVKSQVYENERLDKSNFYKKVWGQKYRDLYGQEVEVQSIDLATYQGGLKVLRAGGGHQTRALRLEDASGKIYNLRALKKSAVQFLQTTLFKESNVATKFEETSTEDLIYDFYTAAHPFAFLTIPGLADAAGVYHTNPKLVYVPKQTTLGKYNAEYGDELYMLVERPDKTHTEQSTFGEPDDIVSTHEVFEKLRKDEKYKIDEPHYIRSRLFDMLIGDWDRHQDQWRWSEFEQKDGTHLYRPIPRDRDQAFAQFNGAFFDVLRTFAVPARQFPKYDEEVKYARWFNKAAVSLDRRMVQAASKEQWMQEAAQISANVTDEVIDAALKNLPAEVFAHQSTEEIRKSLMKRRDNLSKIAEDYYKILARHAVMVGTDKDDIVEIEQMDRKTMQVSIYRNKGGEKADLISSRTFDADMTKEIWIYTLNDKDRIVEKGPRASKIKVRVIGGQDNDSYEFEKGNNITIYDHKSLPNNFDGKARASLRKSDEYELNTYDTQKEKFAIRNITPLIGFNPDDGLLTGMTARFTTNGFYRNPFTTQHSFNLGYYFETGGYDLNYKGTFAGLVQPLNFVVTGRYASPNFAENFFGFGNETENFDDDLDFDFNRVRISEISGAIGVEKIGEYGGEFLGTIGVQGFEVSPDGDRFIGGFMAPGANTDFFDRLWMLDLRGEYSFESYDDKLAPGKGMNFNLVAGVTSPFRDFEEPFAYVNPSLEFFNPLTNNRRLVLRTQAQGQLIIGNNFEFYQSAQLGATTGLRAYREERFSGDRAIAGSADLRYRFKDIRTSFVPLQFGIFAGADVGRVWADNDPSTRWHNGYGGGFWINSAQLLNTTVQVFNGVDGARISFVLGVSL